MSRAAPGGHPLRTLVVWMLFIVSVHTFADAWAQSRPSVDERNFVDTTPAALWGESP